METLGGETGVTVEVTSLKTDEVGTNSQNTQKVTSHSKERYLSAELALSGEWEEVYHLLHAFEHMPYVVILDKVMLQEEVEKGAAIWSGQVSLRVLAR